MLNSHAVHPDPTSATESLTTKLAWAILIIVTLGLCYFSHLGAIGFVGPDEPRYAWIARAMYETGDWITPRLYGQPWFEKPVLYYWGAAASFKLFGVSETAARLPSALSALLATVALAWLALRLYGKETARWLLLLLPTSVGMIGFSHAASTDMPFSGMLTIAMVCAAVAVGLTRNQYSPVIERTPWLALFGFGFFLGAAVLAKGPAAVILSGGAIFFWALRTRRWRDAFRLFHPVALLTFFATALPWYIVCARRNPTFFHVFIIEHNFNRYLTPEFQHLQPFWYYVPVVLISFFPWIIFLVWSLVVGFFYIRAKKQISQTTLFLLCWSFFCILFFSTSHSKLPGYVLPAIPAIALLLARSRAVFASSHATPLRWVFGTTGLMFIAIAIALVRVSRKLPFATAVRPPKVVIFLAILFIFAGFAIAYFSHRKNHELATVLVILPILWPLIYFSDGLRQLDGGVSARPAALSLQSSPLPIGIVEAQTFKLPRGFKYAMNYYFHRELDEWTPSHGKNLLVIFTTPAHRKELEQYGISCFSGSSAVLLCDQSNQGLDEK